MDFVAQWLAHLFQSMDDRLDDETRRAVLSACSEVCTRDWAMKAREIRAEAQRLRPGAGETDITSLLSAFCQALPGGGPDVQVAGPVITWRFSGGDCPCPVARLTRAPGLCLCGVGHVRGMLEPLLGRPVVVELERSRLRGDPECAYRIDCGSRGTSHEGTENA
jgi:hypothetical protein